MRRSNWGRRARSSGSITWTEKSGTRPTSDRTFMGSTPSPRVQHVVEEAVLLVPQIDALAHAAHVPMASAICMKCSKNFDAMSS